MNNQQQWYVTIAGNAVGPVSTDLVLRGIKHKKIATEAYVCVVGATEWQALTDVPEFHGALKENGLLPTATSLGPQPTNGNVSTLASIAEAQETAQQEQTAEALSSVDDDDESETTAQFPSSRRSDIEHRQGAQAPAAAPAHIEQSVLPSPAPTSASEVAEAPVVESEQPLPSEPRNGKHAAAVVAHAQMPGIEVDIDVSMDEPEAPSIDWSHGFSDYFLVDAEVTLPDDQLLLRSLTTTPHDTFLHDEPMWNLALCLAFGSNMVASVAADVFFEVVAAHSSYDRIEWMARTLLSRGFMPSGIPHPAGNRGIGRLRQACPEELRVQLESQLAL